MDIPVLKCSLRLSKEVWPPMFLKKLFWWLCLSRLETKSLFFYLRLFPRKFLVEIETQVSFYFRLTSFILSWTPFLQTRIFVKTCFPRLWSWPLGKPLLLYVYSSVADLHPAYIPDFWESTDHIKHPEVCSQVSAPCDWDKFYILLVTCKFLTILDFQWNKFFIKSPFGVVEQSVVAVNLSLE